MGIVQKTVEGKDMSIGTTLLIGGHRKSGTTVLHSLFDGHEELYVPPHDLNILYGFHPGWTRPDISRKEQEDRLRKVTIDRWRARYEKTEDGTERFNILKSYIDSNIAAVDLSQPGEVVDLIVSALWGTVKQGAKILVLKETSTEMYVPWLLADRPEWKFLHLVRDPRDNYAALSAGQQAYYEKLGDDALSTQTSTIIRYKLGIQSLCWNKKHFGEQRYRVLRFEDLVNDPTKTMQEISAWLGISWAESLVVPTRNGEPFLGNSHDGKKFSGVSAENVGKWKERISPEAAGVLEHVLGEEMKMNGYKKELSEAYSAKCAAEWYGKMSFTYFFSDPF